MAAAHELVTQTGIPQSGCEHPDIIKITYGPKNDKEARAQADGKPFERARSIRVDQIRGMQNRLTTRPTLGESRVIIINPADDMEVGAANALLKSLEEPPRGTYFVLVTHRPSRLLPTIRSRCRMLRFPTLSDVQLESMFEQAESEISSRARIAAIRAAEGSFGVAMRFAEQDLGPIADQVTDLIKNGETKLAARADLAKMIGPRADRQRLLAVMELAQAITAECARSSASHTHRAALIETHSALVELANQAPSYNFDTGLLTLEIGTLLMRAGQASEHAHG